MPKSHLGIGAGKKIHMLYKALKRRQAAEAAGDAEAAGITIPCPACAGKHRAHTCARGLTQPRAAPGEKAATAARLGAATAAPARPAVHFERIEDQDEIDDFFDIEKMRERQLDMLREERDRADATLAAATADTTAVASVTAAAQRTMELLCTPARLAYKTCWVPLRRRLASGAAAAAAADIMDTDADAPAAAPARHDETGACGACCESAHTEAS